MNVSVDRDPSPMPHCPEALDSQRARYPLAVADVFDVEMINLGACCRPGEQRRCIFDSRDGLRLIVSREAFESGVYLHLSASLDDECPLYADVKRGRLGPGQFFEMAVDRFRQISGDGEPLDFGGLSSRGIPHWFREEVRR